MSTHIFLIDDDPMQLHLGEFLIKKHQPGAACTSFTNASVAIEFLSDKHQENELMPDLILLDLDMPQLSGWGFLHLFNRLDSFIKKEISVVVISSSADHKAQTMLRRYKFVKGAFLKPLTGEIVRSVTNLPGLNVQKSDPEKRKYV